MKYTYEERDRLVTDYANRNGITKDKTSELFTYGKLIEKYGSGQESYLVENPDCINENGKLVKTRRRNTHLTPKKKKRK